VRTRSLASRRITTPHDTYGYGKRCPAECTETVKSGCGFRLFEACAVDPCDTDCSTVDMQSHPPRPGTSTGWRLQHPPGSKQNTCVFQFWKVLTEGNGKSPRLLLAGETSPQVDSSSDPAVYQLNSGFPRRRPLIIDATDFNADDWVLGFRGCSFGPPSPAGTFAKICLYGDVGFNMVNQLVELDREQMHWLANARRAFGAIWAGELLREAGRPKGVADGDPRVMIPNTDSDAKPALGIQVLMAPRPPGPISIAVRDVAEAGDDLRLQPRDPPRDHGAALLPRLAVALRKIFGPMSDGRQCQFTPLPSCEERPREPCVDGHLTLKNLPMASLFEAKMWAQNEAGEGEATTVMVQTRARAGIPRTECSVAKWVCGSSDTALHTFMPADSAGCDIGSPPLPSCRADVGAKCHGKKSWTTCEPVMVLGNTSCVSPGFAPTQICVNMPSSPSPPAKPPPKCTEKGCSMIFPGWRKSCCCRPGGADDVEDSSTCACTRAKCADLGLVPAAFPERACRH